MDCTLRRTDRRPDGIFSILAAASGVFSCKTLDHAYPTTAYDQAGAVISTGWSPKLIPGVYTCVRGMHTLLTESGEPVTCARFEITGVDGYKGILIHKGNVNNDSDGCVLTGLSIGVSSLGVWSLVSSEIAFDTFMQMQIDVDSFQLVVE